MGYTDTFKYNKKLLMEESQRKQFKYFIEVELRDASKLIDIIEDNRILRKALLQDTLVPDGATIYETDDEDIFVELLNACEENNIILASSSELQEGSTSANAGSYMTPNAFSEVDDDTVEMLGYKKVKPSSKKDESLYKKVSSEMFLMNEISYNEYKNDPISTPHKKINQSIKFINRGLSEIEKVVNQNVKLKQESGVSNSQYWKSSRQNLVKISERLIRISNRLKDLSN